MTSKFTRRRPWMELFVIFPRRHPSSSHTHIGLNATLAAGGSSPIFDCSAPLTASVSRNYAKELKFLLQGASLLCSREPIFIFIATPGFYDEPLSPSRKQKKKKRLRKNAIFILCSHKQPRYRHQLMVEIIWSVLHVLNQPHDGDGIIWLLYGFGGLVRRQPDTFFILP